MNEKTTYTRYSSPTNSTEFSACCGLAVLKSENKCPGCGALVTQRVSNIKRVSGRN